MVTVGAQRIRTHVAIGHFIARSSGAIDAKPARSRAAFGRRFASRVSAWIVLTASMRMCGETITTFC